MARRGRIVAVGALLVVALTGAGLLGRRAWNARAARQAVEAAGERRFERHRAALEEDHRILAAHPLAAIWSPSEGPPRDAGPFLNPRVPWVGAARWWPPGGIEPLVASEALRRAVERDAFAEAPEQVPLPRASLAALDTLAAYDRWELLAGDSPLATWEGSWVDAPSPEFQSLVALQRARHAQGRVEGDPAAAIRTGRALARLLFGTGSLVGAMYGVSILLLEEQVAAAARARGLTLGELEPLEAALLARLGRATLGAPVAWEFTAPPGATALRATIRAGRCAAIAEDAGIALELRPWLTGEDAARLADLRAALEEPGCTTALVRREWDRPVDTSAAAVTRCLAHRFLPTTVDACDVGTVAAWLPGVRGIVGDELAAIEPPDRLRRYELP